MSVHHLSSIQEYQSLVQNNPNKLIVLDLSAQWCGPCKRIAPAYNQLAQKMPNIIFCKADIDECEDLARTFNVSAVPTFGFVRNGNIVNTVKGANIQAVVQACNQFQNS
jgi:thioredoxin 1